MSMPQWLQEAKEREAQSEISPWWQGRKDEQQPRCVLCGAEATVIDLRTTNWICATCAALPHMGLGTRRDTE